MDAKLEKLLENEDFLKGVVACKTPEEMMRLFEANNIVLEDGMTPEEAFVAVKQNQTDELDETALEKVSGGIGLVALGVASGSAIVASGALAFIGGYAYQKGKNRGWW